MKRKSIKSELQNLKYIRKVRFYIYLKEIRPGTELIYSLETEHGLY
jgi:hypothetical protein